MYAKRRLGILAVAAVVAGCADLSQPILPADNDSAASMDGTTAPLPAPNDEAVLYDGEVCYDERGGGAMGSGGRVVVPCPTPTS
jgi:hypothetical protein